MRCNFWFYNLTEMLRDLPHFTITFSNEVTKAMKSINGLKCFWASSAIVICIIPWLWLTLSLSHGGWGWTLDLIITDPPGFTNILHLGMIHSFTSLIVLHNFQKGFICTRPGQNKITIFELQQWCWWWVWIKTWQLYKQKLGGDQRSSLLK